MGIGKIGQLGQTCEDCSSVACQCLVHELGVPLALVLDFELHTTTPTTPESTEDCTAVEEFVVECTPPYTSSSIEVCPATTYDIVHDQALIDAINALSPVAMSATSVLSGYNALTDQDCCNITYEVADAYEGDDAAWAELYEYVMSNRLLAVDHPAGSTVEVDGVSQCGVDPCETYVDQQPDTFYRTKVFIHLNLNVVVCRNRTSGSYSCTRRLGVTAWHGDVWESEDPYPLFGSTYNTVHDLMCGVSDTVSGLGVVADAAVLPAIEADTISDAFDAFSFAPKYDGHYGPPRNLDNCSRWASATACCDTGIFCIATAFDCVGPGPFDEHYYAVDALEATMTFV